MDRTLVTNKQHAPIQLEVTPVNVIQDIRVMVHRVQVVNMIFFHTKSGIT